MTQPAAKIFKAMPTPQSDSFCPLQNCRGYELFLWQDLRYSPGHPKKEEQGLRIDEGTWNRLLEGLPTLIGVAKTDGSSDFVFDQDTAFLFTGPFELTAYKNGKPDEHETAQLATRLRYVRFSRPALKRTGRAPKPCPFCWSRWLLLGQLYWLRETGQPLDEFFVKVADALEGSAQGEEPAAVRQCMSPDSQLAAWVHSQPESLAAPGLLDSLSSLIQWRCAGHLTESEFIAAKRKLGLF